MAIDPWRKRFVMNIQLRQCFARAKPFRLKISQKKPDFSGFSLFSKNAKGFQKKPEFLNLPSKKPDWQPCYTRIENAREVRKKTFYFLLCIEVHKIWFSFSPAETLWKCLNASMLTTAVFELVQQFYHATEFANVTNTVSACTDQP